MIRKMVAVAAEAARVGRGEDAPGELLDGLTDDREVCLQLMPGDGLYLGAPVFESYNRYKASPPDRPPLEWEAGHPAHDAIERFRVDVVESGIVGGGEPAALVPWVYYLWQARPGARVRARAPGTVAAPQVRVFGFPLSPDDAVPVPNIPRL